MCGIVGYFSSKWEATDLERAVSKLIHRGPDATGTFVDNEVGLGHRRLSIIDLSEAANQPMQSNDLQHVLAFNGELYNYQELLTDNTALNSNSDTAVLLQGLRQQGVDFLSSCNGMFAFAYFNRSQKELLLARDRFGIKPLYYYWDGEHFAFASELKALIELGVPKAINNEAVQDYLFLEYIPAPHSILQNVFKLEAGHYLTFNGKQLSKRPYYSLLDQLAAHPSDVQENEAIEEFHSLFNSSVKYRSISDVPVGAFLSGGTDSSLVCAAFQQQNESPIRTFNIGFDVGSHDESEYARQVAKVLQTEHHEHRLDAGNSRPMVDSLPGIYDEPFAVPSCIPSLQVCKNAREQMTVALSGDGGDELFMGYGHYFWADRVKKINRLGGRTARKLTSTVLSKMDHRKQRAARVLDFKSTENAWLHIWSQEQYMFNEAEISKLLKTPYQHQTLIPMWKQIGEATDSTYLKISLFDIQHYLANDLLHKVDMASMAYSLEVRVPFLDHRLIEFAINLPDSLKIKAQEQKYLLKKALEKHLPKELIYRTKWGFPAPVNEWLHGELNFLMDQYLNAELIERQGIFDVATVLQLRNEFEGGVNYHFKRIWAIITFNRWYEHYMES